MRSLLLLAFLIPLSGLVSGQQDEKKEPAKENPTFAIGKDLPGHLNPFNVNGASKRRFHDPIGPHGLDPFVLILTSDVRFSEELKKLLVDLDNAIEKNPTVRLGACAVFFSKEIPNVVTDDDARESLAGELDALAKDLMLKHVILAIDSADNAETFKSYLEGTHIFLIHKLRIQGIYGGEKLIPETVTKLMTTLADKMGAKRK
jgi:hypothetical protein